MSDRTNIEWATATWNPVVGCSKVSPGCANCYAAAMAWRLGHNPRAAAKYQGLTERASGSRAQWTGVVRGDPDALALPARWRRHRRIFVGSMGDLFHDQTPADFLDDVFATMAANTHHTYLLLTKRPDNMRRAINRAFPSPYLDPFNCLWLGVTAEDQPRADLRVPVLRATRAARRFLSCEPLLGPITLDLQGIHWVIAGGETGPHARPVHPDWLRSLRDQCAAANTPFFFKQWGGPQGKDCALDGHTHRQFPESRP